MRDKPSDAAERGRISVDGYIESPRGALWGAFIMIAPQGARLRIISNGGQDGWEHVSVSIAHRVPTWAEMCFVKDAFWKEEECVMQLHPPKADYVNCHPNCLHMWRPIDATVPMPPKWML